MDGEQFDRIARLLATKPSRRGALAALAGAGLAALLPSGRGVAAACVENLDCGQNEYCSEGLCCSINRHNEGGVCVCGYACGRPEYCSADECEGRCVDLRTSERHCGACGNKCGREERCRYDPEREESRCCAKGKIPCGGRCVACDGWNRSCIDGACRCTYLECKGRCVNPDWSQNHCGRCGNACKDDEHCSYGHCCPRHHQWCEHKSKCVFAICNGEDGHHAYEPDTCLCSL